MRGLKQRNCNWGSLRTLFAGRGAVVFQRQHGELVDGGEAREVGGVLLCRAEDELALLLDAVLFSRQYSFFPGFVSVYRRDSRSGSEEKDHAAGGGVSTRVTSGTGVRGDWDLHKRMGEADLGAVDGTVARRLDEGEEVMVSGIDDDLLEDGLFARECQCQLGCFLGARCG